MRLFISYLKMHWKVIGIATVCFVVQSLAFLLFQMPWVVFWYAIGLCIFLGMCFMAADFYRFRKKYKALQTLKGDFLYLHDSLPLPEGILEEEYQRMVQTLRARLNSMEVEQNRRYNDLVDYYTVWVHQIKTPIAAMNLKLHGQDSVLCRELGIELVRIEQYVDMVLCYLRLDSESTDYVLKEYDLDNIIRQAVKQMASQFIGKQIRLCYESLDIKVLTDEKWLLFVIGQVLSNALKYTKQGSITITLQEPKTLCIRDTGIGIAPDDLPRIFEKGFTGFNGREDKKASGIGLYLCKRICCNLGHQITAESVVDEGTVIRIALEHQALVVE